MSQISTESSYELRKPAKMTKQAIYTYLIAEFQASRVYDYYSFKKLSFEYKGYLVNHGLCPTYLHELIPTISLAEARHLLYTAARHSNVRLKGEYLGIDMGTARKELLKQQTILMICNVLNRGPSELTVSHMADDLIAGIATLHFRTRYKFSMPTAASIMARFQLIKEDFSGEKLQKTVLDLEKAQALHLQYNAVGSSIAEKHAQLTSQQTQEAETMQAVNLLLKEHLVGFKFVTVVFNVAQPSHQQKKYTYKTNLDVAQDDYCVVQTPEGKFETVRVVEVDVVPIGTYEYKWLVAKLDFTAFETVKTVEAEVKQILLDDAREKEEKAKLAEVKANLGKKGIAKIEQAIKRTRI